MTTSKESVSDWQNYIPTPGEIYQALWEKWGSSAQVESHTSAKGGQAIAFADYGEVGIRQIIDFDCIGPKEVELTGLTAGQLAYNIVWERQADGTFRLEELEQRPVFPQFAKGLAKALSNQNQPR